TDVASAASPAGLAGREKEQGVEQGVEGRDKAAAVLASLPVRTPLPTSTVRDLTPHVAALLASGWTPSALTDHLTSGLPASYGPGLIVQRVRDTRPRVRPSTGGSGGVLPACGTCGAREGEPPSVRTVDVIDDGRLRARRCPDCRGTDTHAQGVRRRHLYAIPWWGHLVVVFSIPVAVSSAWDLQNRTKRPPAGCWGPGDLLWVYPRISGANVSRSVNYGSSPRARGRPARSC